MVGAPTPAFGKAGAAVAGGVVTVAIAQIQSVSVVQLGFLHTPAEQIILLGQLAFVVQLLPHCGTAVGVAVGTAVGVAVAQIQFVDDVHNGFLQTEPEQIMLFGQSALVEHVVPHCGTAVGVGDAVGLADVVGVAVAQTQT